MERLSLPLCQFRIPEISVCPAWLFPFPSRQCVRGQPPLAGRVGGPDSGFEVNTVPRPEIGVFTCLWPHLFFHQTSPSPERQGTPAMLASLDIFRMEDGTYVWKATADSLELAKLKVEELATNAPGEYMIFSQTTGNKIVVNPDGLPELGARHHSQ